MSDVVICTCILWCPLSCDMWVLSSVHQVDECMKYDPKSGPFLIGLTGAMATGKSSVAARLVKKGAYLINCDKV